MTTPETAPSVPELAVEDWGTVDYEEALRRQLELVERVASEDLPGVLVVCSHPPVITLGRATQPGDVFAWSGPIIEIARGGRATYHGPSQLVIYPILNLKHARRGRAPQEIAGYLRTLENVLIDWLAEQGLTAEGRSLRKKAPEAGEAEETGVWVGARKVASLGLGVKKWVAYHGAALNLENDPQAFTGMNPCGFRREVMVSVEELLGRRLDRARATREIVARLLKAL